MIRPVSPRKLKLQRDCTDDQYVKALVKYLRAKKKEKLLKEKTKRKIRREKKAQSIPVLLKKADAVFSKWIRNRDGNKCVLCGSTTNVQCGHLIRRGKKSVRFDETNCNAQCSRCNYLHNQYPEKYTRWWLNRYGQEAYDLLVNRSGSMHQWMKSELLTIIEFYESRV